MSPQILEQNETDHSHGVEDHADHNHHDAVSMLSVEGFSVLFGGDEHASNIVTSRMGWRWGRMHKGTDFGGEIGQNLYTPVAGTVTKGYDECGYGHWVAINSGTEEFFFAHLDKESTLVNGSRIDKGDKVGELGSSGSSTGPHLHLEVKVKGILVNPEEYFAGRSFNLSYSEKEETLPSIEEALGNDAEAVKNLLIEQYGSEGYFKIMEGLIAVLIIDGHLNVQRNSREGSSDTVTFSVMKPSRVGDNSNHGLSYTEKQILAGLIVRGLEERQDPSFNPIELQHMDKKCPAPVPAEAANQVMPLRGSPVPAPATP